MIRKSRKSRPTKSKLKNKMDKLWAKCVRLNGKCEYCGSTQNLNAHHIFSRSKISTRWLLINGICLCVSCHTFSTSFSAHKTPIEFTYWLEESKGKRFINKLRKEANEVAHYTIDDLQNIYEELKKYYDKHQ